ncbi:unnamed protein product [Closterium sp. Naga37s-1]|nr:unnamed protein product [Closterium sp. Naga37s-1]
MAPRLPVENGAAHHPHAESGGALSASAGGDAAKAEQPPPSPAAKGIDGDGAALSALASGDEGATGGDVAAVLSRHSAADWFIYPVVLRHFPVRVLFHDRTAVTFGKPYVIAVEPHSVLPVGLGAFMCHALAAGGVAGATSAIFRVPLLRQCWQWARLAPATRALLSGVLQRGRPVIIVPGGVQECLFMAPGKEVVFIRQRFGFIRLALQHGAPVLPCFVFGQTSAYRWWKPQGEWYGAVARRLGFAPILFWGMWGSPIPFRTPLTIVIGTPIGQGDPDPNPSKERVAAVHAQYVSALERLFLDYRAQAGYPTTQLEIL